MAALVGFKPPQSRKRQLEHDSESEGFESTGEVESEEDETPEEKRLRLAQIYLEELQRKGKKPKCQWTNLMTSQIWGCLKIIF